VSQLQEYINQTEGKLSSSLRVENGNNTNHSKLKALNGFTPLPAVEHAQPTEYPQPGYASIGCPTVLNASIVVGALQNRGVDQRNPPP
jgi:hypothetical protein